MHFIGSHLCYITGGSLFDELINHNYSDGVRIHRNESLSRFSVSNAGGENRQPRSSS